jgi:hypothetical protein
MEILHIAQATDHKILINVVSPSEVYLSLYGMVKGKKWRLLSLEDITISKCHYVFISVLFILEVFYVGKQVIEVVVA